jgi:hypothetical protein
LEIALPSKVSEDASLRFSDSSLPSKSAHDSWRVCATEGGILTVADELLKNDGQKFLAMMESLADKRIQREREAAESIMMDDDEDLDDDDEDYEDG